MMATTFEGMKIVSETADIFDAHAFVAARHISDDYVSTDGEAWHRLSYDDFTANQKRAEEAEKKE